jgi:hypothetical protein
MPEQGRRLRCLPEVQQRRRSPHQHLLLGHLLQMVAGGLLADRRTARESSAAGRHGGADRACDSVQRRGRQ